MLAAVRRSVRSWAAGLILFIALIAIVITGFGTDGFGGLGSLSSGTKGEVLATVNGKQLTETEASDILNRQYSRARQEQPELGMTAFLESAFEPIIDQLVLALAVQSFGEEQGLIVSDRMIDREIVNIPAFRNFAGQFDDATFRQALQGQNITEAQLRQDIGRSLMQRQLLGPIARGANVPEAIAREYANLLLERRRGTIVGVPVETMAVGIAPTEAEVAAFYQRRRARFTIPERRVIRYAMIGADQVAGATRATDAEIQAYYRDNQARFGPREIRDLQQVVLPDQASAQRLVAQVRGGTTFAAAAAQAGFAAGDIALPNQTQAQFAQVTSAEASRAAFAAQQGAVIGPVRSPLGFHVVRVERVRRTAGQPLEAVRAEIARTIEERKRVDALVALTTRIEDRLADGASLEEVAAAERLTLASTPAVTQTGQVPGGSGAFPAELQPLLRSGFDIDPEEPEALVEEIERNRRYALVGLERVLPAAPPPLASIRDQVRAALVRERALARAREVAQRIVAALNRGTPVRQAIAAAGVSLPSQPLDLVRRDIARSGSVSPQNMVLFSLPARRAHAIPAPEGTGWYVIHHAERVAGDANRDPEAIAATRSNFTRSAGEEIAQQFARAVEGRSGLERNANAIAALKQRMLGAAAE